MFSIAANSISARARQTHRRGVPNRHYAAAVTLTAVLLVGFALWRAPVKGYVAEASLRADNSAARLELGRVSTWLKSDEVLAAAANAVETNERLSVADLRHDLAIFIPDTLAGKSFDIRLVAHRPATAAAVVNALSQQFTTSYLRQERQTARAAELSRLRGLVQAARMEEDRLRVDVDRLRQEQVARVISATRTVADAAVEAEQNQAGRSAAADERPSRLREQLDTLKLQRNLLLGDRTTEHPQVVALENQITRLENELAREATAGLAPPDLAGALALNVPPQVTSEAEIPHQAVDAAAPVDPLINVAAEVENAVHELSQATWARQQAEYRLETALGNATAGTEAIGWTAEPATIIGRLGGTPSPLQMLASMVFAFGAALAIYRTGVRAEKAPPLSSVEDVRQSLDLPLVAELSLASDAALRQPRLDPARTVRLATHAAEAVVGAAIVICLISAIADRALALEFAGDPLGALAVVADRLRGVL
jgi:hypothetical protein